MVGARGTKTGTPERAANATVCIVPPSGSEYTATTARESATCTRLRAANRHRSGAVPGGYALTSAPPLATMASASASCSGG